MRFTSDGQLDSSFANDGVFDLSFGTIWGVEAIDFQSNGQIVLGFCGDIGGPLVARLNPNGTIDTTFGSEWVFLRPDRLGPGRDRSATE